MLDNKQKRHGFTLIELAITLSIVGIVAAIALISWPRFTINLNAQAELLAGDIRYVQNLAMSRSERYRLVKVSSNSYQVADSNGTAVVMPSGNSTVTFGSGVAFGTITNLPNNLVVFDSKGIPYVDTGNPGTPLGATAIITLTASGNNKTISIAPETGWVNVP